MDRRSFLTWTGVATLTAGSGCIGDAIPNNAGNSRTTEPSSGRTRVRTPEPGDIALTVDRLGAESQPEPNLTNESDATLDMAGSIVKFDTGQQHEISTLRLVPGAELDVVTAREGCVESVAESYPPIHTRCARFAEPASTMSGTVTVTNPDGEVLAEKNY